MSQLHLLHDLNTQIIEPYSYIVKIQRRAAGFSPLETICSFWLCLYLYPTPPAPAKHTTNTLLGYSFFITIKSNTSFLNYLNYFLACVKNLKIVRNAHQT